MNQKYCNRPYVEIVEQPAGKSMRFRYMCEGRSIGSLPGVNSTSKKKTFPSIRINGYKGRAVVVVSCVTNDEPYRPHPHSIVGKDTCKQGVCTVAIYTDGSIIAFTNLGIQCVKRREIQHALQIREDLRVDPFKNGLEYKNRWISIDVNSIRLCFQVFIEDPREKKCCIPLDPVVSDPIYDKKVKPELIICKMSHDRASVIGGLEMIILCERVNKNDIQVVFFEMDRGGIVWQGLGDFHPADVHKQMAITLRTPAYRTFQVNQPIQVFVQLRRPSDGELSDALPFMMTPGHETDPVNVHRKRQKLNSSSSIIPQPHCSQCACNLIPDYSKNNAPEEARALPIPKENDLMAQLRRLQAEAEKNGEKRIINNELPWRNYDYGKQGMLYRNINSNHIPVIKYPDPMTVASNNVDPLSQMYHQSIKASNNPSQTVQNYLNNAPRIYNNPPNPMTAHASSMSQSMWNEPQMLYKVTSQKQESAPQQQNLPNLKLNNYVTQNPTVVVNNQLNFDNNLMNDTKTVDSAELLALLTQNFSTSVSITDATEIQPVRDRGKTAENNYWYD